VAIAPLNSTVFRVIGSGTGSVTNSTLATFDPTLLANDQYVIRVVARDTSNRVSRREVTVNVAGELKLGRFRLEVIDFELPVAGIPIQVRRTYDTLDAGADGDFGFGWRLGFNDARIRETVPANAGQGILGPVSAPFKVGTKVYLTTPDGRRVGFTFDPQPVPIIFFGTYWRPAFKPDPGVTDKLDTIYDPDNPYGDLYQKLADGSFARPFAFFAGAFNPDVYHLTTPDGMRYHYDQFKGLQEVLNPNGSRITFTDAGITSSTGLTVPFHRDAQGRIAAILDPTGTRSATPTMPAGPRAVTDQPATSPGTSIGLRRSTTSTASSTHAATPASGPATTIRDVSLPYRMPWATSRRASTTSPRG
jgi:hypothetical protein